MNIFETSPILAYNRNEITMKTCREAAANYDAMIRAAKPGSLEHIQATKAWFAWSNDADKAERANKMLVANYTK